VSAAAPTKLDVTARAHCSGVEIVFVDLEASGALLEAEEAATPRLSASDILRVERLSLDPVRQRLWRSARIATRIVLERAAGGTVRRIDFEIAATGRPLLGEGFPHFNVSHSGEAALIAVSEATPIGVDIEQLRTLAMTEDRRRRIVAAAATLADGPALDLHRDADVLRAWVRLEAMGKARGTGIGRLLTEQGVIGGANAVRGSRAASDIHVVDLSVPTNYVSAMAIAASPQSMEVIAFPTRAEVLATFLSEAYT
jgi:4'-phosphopantetheinyl transferase